MSAIFAFGLVGGVKHSDWDPPFLPHHILAFLFFQRIQKRKTISFPKTRFYFWSASLSHFHASGGFLLKANNHGLLVTSPETSPQPRVYFQTPAGTTEEPETPSENRDVVTVKYDRKELRKRLNLEEWIIDQLTDLYDCEEEAIPELEIDVDELLDMPSDVERAARVKDLLVDCFKPTEDFISALLDKIRGMQKLSTPQKK
ncbi:protein phosphatase 1, regulatory (inhibitor) subunit 14Bb [Periophthalmus magnuspinnatus]|uniref:protein phosphatase 1, regulatory (inhibitor) subunit 14Bb n=1 Tax=Periophthalmus magnuspinnatus TaxID=409849 RepID=UPI00145A84C3|nr:protein phosphatase 1, regulatory (inhibitor) subunit 14Bb [Periophthalmus magnuspinnatus]